MKILKFTLDYMWKVLMHLVNEASPKMFGPLWRLVVGSGGAVWGGGEVGV